MIQQQTDSISSYVPYLSFGKDTHQVVNEQFIKPKVKKFFAARQITYYQPLKLECYISDKDYKDYKTLTFECIYDCVLAEIRKELSTGKVSLPVKYEITLDEQVTSKTCRDTQIKYDEILLNNSPILYFIYIDLKELLSFVRENCHPATNSK